MRLSHSFSVEYAEKYGIECAILINHFQFWIEQNQATGKNFHDGRTWMYQTQKEISAIYPYLSEDAVFRIVNKLIEHEVLIKDNYNKTSFDKTAWYAFKNEKMFTKPRNRGIETAESRNRDREPAETIPDTNTDTKKKTATAAAPPAAAFSPQPTTQEIHKCLEDVDITLAEKVKISKNFDAKSVSKAVAWAMHPSTKINKDLVSAIKWACKEQPEIPKNPMDIASENKEYAKEIQTKLKKVSGVNYEVLNEYVEIHACGSGNGSGRLTCINYTENGFKEQLINLLKKFNLL